MHTPSLPLTILSPVLSCFLSSCGQLSVSMVLLVWSHSLAQFTLLLEATCPWCHMVTQHWQPSLVNSLAKNPQIYNIIKKRKKYYWSHRLWEDRGGKVWIPYLISFTVQVSRLRRFWVYLSLEQECLNTPRMLFINICGLNFGWKW